MTANTLNVLQAVGFFLQTVNAGLSGVVHSPVASLLVAAFVGTFQMYLHQAGVQVVPPK